MTIRRLSNSCIEADRLQIVLNADPVGLPTYNGAFLVRMKPANPDNPPDEYQRVTMDEAREIARFLSQDG